MVLLCACLSALAMFSKRLWEDDAELGGGLEASGRMSPVLKSALVWSCRIACGQSNNVNSSSRIACEYGAMPIWCLIRLGRLFQGMFMENCLCADVSHWLMPICVRDFQLCYWVLAGMRTFRRVWEDDAELGGGLEASGSMPPVLKSALVWSCRIAYRQSNDVNSSNRSAHESMALCPCDVS
ncbi:hypothetical protein cyc_00008 [Cyclospora cayetanensis]|uniref:Secreted protein n=1 Tax=Cyclospora cayetanensis TaxID=88456 RepID=A0A1D3CSB3_9EIME|nr:hypothetical protein cyc_00008 [Cyclospora cayetanensis]